MLIGPLGVQEGLGIVLVRFYFRLAVRVRFFDPLGLLLGPSWGALGPVFGCLGLSWGRFGAFRGTFWSLQLLSYLLCVLPALCFLLSAHGPRNCNSYQPWPCGLRAARLNKTKMGEQGQQDEKPKKN